MVVIKNTSASRRNDKSQPPARGGGGSKGNQPKGSSLQSAAQRGQKDAPTTVKQGGSTDAILSGPTDYTHKSGGSKSAYSAVSYATAASTLLSSTASTSLSSAACTWTIGGLGGIVIEEGNTKSNNAHSPMGDQGGANPGDGDIVTNPLSHEQTLLGEADNKRRDRSNSPPPATSSLPQHNQEIRTVMEGTGASMRDGNIKAAGPLTGKGQR